MYSFVGRTKASLCLITWLALLPAALFAQQISAEADAGISRTVVEERLREVQEASDLDAEDRDELIDLYRQALGFIDDRRTSDAAAAAFAQARNDAPAESERIRAENEQARTVAAVGTLNLPADVDVNALEQRLQQEKANQAAASTRLGTITQQLAAEAARPNQVRQRLVEASQLTDSLGSDLKLPTPAGEHPLHTEAMRWVRTTQANAIDAEMRMLELEMSSQPMRLELLEAQKTAVAASLSRIEAQVNTLTEILTEQRRDETAQIIAEAESAALGEAGENDVVLDLADRNRQLSAQLQYLTEAIEQAATETNTAVELAQQIHQQFQKAQRRIEIAGLNVSLGRVLHEQRRDLPSRRDYKLRAQKRQKELADGGLRDIQYEAEWIELQNAAAYIDNLIADIPETEWETVREPLNSLVASRHTLIRNSLSANTTYIRALGEQDFEERQLTSKADEFDTFLAKRLLWVRSADSVGQESLRALPQEIAEFFESSVWIEAMAALIERFAAAPVLGLAVLLAGLLLWRTGVLKQAVRDTGRHVGNPSRDSYAATVKAAALSGLLALPWPLIAGVTGWEMTRADFTTDGSKGIAAGLTTVGTILAFLLAARALCLDGGVAQAHFRWPATFVKRVRRLLDQLLLTFTLPGFVLVVTIAQHPTAVGNELTRLMFIVATAALVYFFVKLLRPESGLIDELPKRRDANAKLSILWLLIGAGFPAAMLVAALAGYLYSATTLLTGLIDTLWLLLGLIFVSEMVSRGLVVIRQRLIYQARLDEWEAARAAREQDEGAGSGEEIPLPADEPMVDVANLDTDARQLLNMGLFIALIIGLGAIWSPVMPALTILDDVILWTNRDGIAGAETLVPVTLADLGIVLIILLATIFATRSIPSLLEALLRQQSKFGAGSRLAFATLARYLIVLVGIISIADGIGFRWSQIQWLVAALGVGIGFGLQDIIGNFISGLIILMERPIRVGDIVTIGDVSGRVSRLQIRATTITNWDKQEVLVPNREFITGRVLNWTLSDDIVRLVTTVGVSYGSDIRKAMALISEAAYENEHVLENPQSLITFEEFGDSSLNITLRCFIDSPNLRREVRSQLNLSISEKLADAGIVVAFPQRDVHLSTERPLEIRIRDGQHGSES